MARRAINKPAVEASAAEGSPRAQLPDIIASFQTDPLGYVLFAFPWKQPGTKLAEESGPDEWHREALTRLGEEVRRRDGDGGELLGAIMIAVASGHGVGKTAFAAWVILWMVSTRLDPAVVVTANTLGQLSGKTWRELAKWHRLAINGDWFQWTATSFYLKGRQDTHKALAVPWSKERAEGFQGTHEKDVLMLFDEASAIVDEIWTAADGALTTAGAIWLVLGNPTRNSGRFRECWRKWRHRWITFKVDSRNAKKANQAQIQQWIDDYGEDSDFVRVRVRGEFPRAATLQFISSELVEEAQREFRRRHGDQVKKALAIGAGGLADYKLDENAFAPRLFVVDVSNFGADQTVFGMRQGRTFVSLFKQRELSVPQVAYHAHQWIEAERPDHILVDGVGVGAGVVDLLREMGHEVINANAGMAPLDRRRFANRRAEMWWNMREWLSHGGRIPPDDGELANDLIAPEYGFSDRGERVQLESKDDMRARGLPSTDTADCLAMSFWMPFAPLQRGETLAEKIAIGARAFAGAATWMSF